MPDLKPFRTSDIDLVAAILTECGEVPVTASPGQRLVEFSVDRTERIEKVIIEYSSGGLCQNIRLFSRHRAKLYKAAQQVSVSGWEVIV